MEYVLRNTVLLVPGPPQTSTVSTAPVLTAGTWLAHCTVTSIGQVMIGGVLSVTAIVRLQVDELPQSSVAVHVLVTLYS